MSSQSQVSVCNISLLSIGGRTQISSLNGSDTSVAAQACSTLFSFVYELLARTAPWNCFKKQDTLTLIQAATGTPENPTGTDYPQPPSPWLYAYQIPSDSLMVRYLVPSFPTPVSGSAPISPNLLSAATNFPGVGQIPYSIGYITDSLNNPIEVILTNQSQAQVVYTVNQPNPAVWDSLFTSAFVSSLGAYLVPALALNAALMSSSMGSAERMIAIARAQDGNEVPVVQDHTPDWIRARGANCYGMDGYASGNGMFGGWCGMVWPGA